MRVAVDVTPLLGPRTGVGQFVDHLLAALPAVASPPDVVRYSMSWRGRRGRPALPSGTRTLPLPASVLLRLWSGGDRPAADRWLDGAAVVHGTNFVGPPVRHAGVVVTVHDCWCLRRPEACGGDAVAVAAGLRRAVRRGAWLHVGTDFVAAEAADVLDTDRIAKVAFGVPPVDETGARLPAGVGGWPFVLALGWLGVRKNLDGLVRAFGAPGGPAATDPRVRLVLAGPDGPARPAIDGAIAALPTTVAERVLLVGEVTDAERRGLLRAAGVLAYPSLHEGFGFPMLEAMAAGTPVVAGASGALPEVAGDAAVLVDPADVEGLAGALTSVLADAERRDALVARGRERAARFTWAATAEGLVAVWRRVAAEGMAP